MKRFHNPQATLDDMGATSNLISKLAASPAPARVPYYVVGSDTGLYRDYGGNDHFLSQVKNWLMGNVVFPGLDRALFGEKPNDMAVTTASMEKITGFDTARHLQILPGDHISYFTEEPTRKAILDRAKN
ncbi:MAG: hypothetical protein LRY55_14245 [Leadbetterella sp.]|nr:hypothetical protein [Leadbetterella sp.]